MLSIWSGPKFCCSGTCLSFVCKENRKWNALPERIRSLSFQPSRGVAAGWNWAYSEKKKKMKSH